jgi:hypothetical protein
VVVRLGLLVLMESTGELLPDGSGLTGGRPDDARVSGMTDIMQLSSHPVAV